jgi:hypothetical protein
LYYSVSKIFCSIEMADVAWLVEQSGFRNGAYVFIGSKRFELMGLCE